MAVLHIQSKQQLYWKLKKALPEHLIVFQVQTSRKNSYPIAVIELDDCSHEKDEIRIETDKKKNKATTDARLRIY